MKELDFTDKDF